MDGGTVCRHRSWYIPSRGLLRAAANKECSSVYSAITQSFWVWQESPRLIYVRSWVSLLQYLLMMIVAVAVYPSDSVTVSHDPVHGYGRDRERHGGLRYSLHFDFRNSDGRQESAEDQVSDRRCQSAKNMRPSYMVGR